MLKIALSPCPNDTFAFYGLLTGQTCFQDPMKVAYEDIQTLNQQAISGEFDIGKVSVATYAKVQDAYTLLPVGAALGMGNGPKLIAHTLFPLADFSTKQVAIPGTHTTAYQLLQHLLPPPAGVVSCEYHEVPTLLAKHKVDAGLIIHETRFTFTEMGFVEICDLGQLWEARYACPLPLGCLIAKKSLDAEVASRWITGFQESLAAAHAQSLPGLWEFVSFHSQEKNLAVIKAHIDLYVNEETTQLSAKGYEAIERLISKGGRFQEGGTPS